MMKCNLCKNKNVVNLNKKVMGSDTAEVFYCESCDHAFLQNVNIEEKFYEEDFDKFMASRSCDTSRIDMEKSFIRSLNTEAEERISFLSKYLDFSKINSILEMGSSNGFMLEKFKERFPDIKIEGIEPGKAARDFSLEKKHKVYSSINEVETKYDCIISFFVLEHISEPELWIKTLVNKLLPKGFFAAIVPNLNEALVKEYADPNYDNFVWQAPHLAYYSSKSLRFLLEKFSNDVKVIDYQRYTLSNHLNWLSGLKPKKSTDYAFVTEEINSLYKKALEDNGRADTLAAFMRVP